MLLRPEKEGEGRLALDRLALDRLAGGLEGVLFVQVAMRSTMARAVWRSTMDWGFQHWVFRPAPTTWMERSSVWAALFTKGAGRRNQARATSSSAAAAIPARRRGQRSPFPRRGRGASM